TGVVSFQRPVPANSRKSRIWTVHRATLSPLLGFGSVTVRSLAPWRVVGPQARASVRAARSGPGLGQLVEAGPPDLEVQVWAGRVPRSAGLGDLLSATDGVAGVHEDRAAAQMVVAGGEHAVDGGVSNDDD